VRGLRRTFRRRAKAWEAGRLKFLDESGLYLGMTPTYGWAPAGERVVDHVPTNYGTAWTTVACLGLGGVQAPWLLEGAMDGPAFATYVAAVLAPTLHPGDILVLDNLAVHKQAAVRAAVEARGATVEFLAPYSPDYNPSELGWAKVKPMLRRAKAHTREALLDALAVALRAITGEDIAHWMHHCGYALP
jgi:transposase